MSMSTHVVGIRPPDSDWKKMKAIWDACEAANVHPPDAVLKFFDFTTPDAKGVLVDLKPREWSADGQAGLEVDISTLPPGVKTIRFYNSW